MPVYRYRLNGPTLSELQRYVDPAVVSVSGVKRVSDIDIDAPASSKADLDQYMAMQGYGFVSTDPTINRTGDEFTFGVAAYLAGGGFLPPGGAGGISAVAAPMIISGSHLIDTLWITQVAGAGTGTVTYQVQVNGAPVGGLAVTVAVTLGGSAVARLAAPVPLVEGDALEILMTDTPILIGVPINLQATVS